MDHTKISYGEILNSKKFNEAWLEVFGIKWVPKTKRELTFLQKIMVEEGELANKFRTELVHEYGKPIVGTDEYHIPPNSVFYKEYEQLCKIEFETGLTGKLPDTEHLSPDHTLVLERFFSLEKAPERKPTPKFVRLKKEEDLKAIPESTATVNPDQETK